MPGVVLLSCMRFHTPPQALQSIHQEQLACKDATIIKLEAEVECLQDEVERARAQTVRLQAQMEMAREGR